MARPKGSKNKKRVIKEAVTGTESESTDLKVEANQSDYQEPTTFAETETHCGCGHEKGRHKDNGCQHACKCLETHQ